jgi:hypothetical protein
MAKKSKEDIVAFNMGMVRKSLIGVIMDAGRAEEKKSGVMRDDVRLGSGELVQVETRFEWTPEGASIACTILPPPTLAELQEDSKRLKALSGYVKQLEGK